MDNDISIIKSKNSNSQFIVGELVPLLNHECIRKEHTNQLPEPSVEVIGIVCGILTMNSEIELLVQFSDGIEQLCKREFENNYLIISE